jgi:hypothetical protein
VLNDATIGKSLTATNRVTLIASPCVIENDFESAEQMGRIGRGICRVSR